jgi:hypothetical protein
LSEDEQEDARPGEKSRGWVKADTQMHLNSMRLGLVNFFLKGARFVRQELLQRQAATQNAVSTLIGSDDNQVE